MLRFIAHRALGAVPVLLAAATLTFLLIRLAPGGPFTEERSYPEEALRQLNRHYGLDQPLRVQYLRYMGKLLRGDLGPSMRYQNRTVNQIIAETFPVSLELGLWALLLACCAGTAAGILAALRPNSVRDHVVMTAAMAGICLPTFVLGPLLVLAFALGLGWGNAAGWETAADRVLPAITLSLPYTAYIARLSRGSMLEVLPQDYIRTARAKGLTVPQVVFRHALRNALLPVISFLGPAAAGLITGSFVVESIFHIPGMGRVFVASALNRDYTLVLGLTVFYAAVIVLFNTAADILLALLDPRIRLARSRA